MPQILLFMRFVSLLLIKAYTIYVHNPSTTAKFSPVRQRQNKNKKSPETLINKGFGSFFVVRVTGLEPAAS